MDNRQWTIGNAQWAILLHFLRIKLPYSPSDRVIRAGLFLISYFYCLLLPNMPPNLSFANCSTFSPSAPGIKSEILSKKLPPFVVGPAVVPVSPAGVAVFSAVPPACD